MYVSTNWQFKMSIDLFGVFPKVSFRSLYYATTAKYDLNLNWVFMSTQKKGLATVQ